MTTWRGRSDDGVFSVELEAAVLVDLDRYCQAAGAAETGGILIGRYSDDLARAVVREATPPPEDSERGRSWFVRGVRGLREMLGKRWLDRDRTFYLGEWHFHPASHVEPSREDFEQMLEICRSREYECRQPLLLVLCDEVRVTHRVFRIFVCLSTGDPIELRGAVVLSTGQLSAHTSCGKGVDGSMSEE